MAVYKVPQDVEADDKLLGPLSFRQFIYAVVAAIAAAVAFFLSQLFVPLVVIPLPIVILFAVLALPLRKDQPMEMYLVAIIRFMLKPRFRLWQPEGNVALVEIVAPKSIEEQRTNGLSQDEARNRLDYLAQVMDSRGWSTRGAAYPGLQTQTVMPIADSDISNDIMDVDANISRNFDNLLAKKDAQFHQETRERMALYRANAAQAATSGAATPIMGLTNMSAAPKISLEDLITKQQRTPSLASQAAYPTPLNGGDADVPSFTYNPYPNDIHQQVVQPLGVASFPDISQNQAQPPTPEQAIEKTEPAKPMTTTLSPDIMRLATESKNLSISTIANEAHRLQQKQDENEVVIQLH